MLCLRTSFLLPALALAACAGETATERAAIFTADLLTPAEQRCADAQKIAADLETAEAAALAAVACAQTIIP